MMDPTWLDRPARGVLRRLGYLTLLAALLLAAVPLDRVRAQSAEPADELPPSLIDLLAASPRLQPVEPPAGAPAVDAATHEPWADRTQYAVLGYRVEGDTVHATVQLRATKSTFISSGRPTQNFSGLANMNLGWDQPSNYNAMRILVQFDLGPLPANAQIRNATFYAYQNYINPPGEGQGMDFRAQFMQQQWSESSVTWNNANYLGGSSLPIGTLSSSVGWISGAATGSVVAWDSGRPNYGVLLTGDETPDRGRWRQLSSRAIPAQAPYLVVDYSANCDTAAPIATMGVLPSFVLSEFRASWSAFDPSQPGCSASGVAWYNVRYRINGGGWVNWKNQSSSTGNHFRGFAPNNALVEFQVQAADRAGNLGAWSATVSTRVDAEAPVASASQLPAYTPYPSFTVSWSGTDALSGIDYYNVQFNKNDSTWQTLLEETRSTSYQVTGGQQGDKYEFRVQAVDRAGNVQNWTPYAQATTTIFTYPVAGVEPFNPGLIKATAPVTSVIPVRWGAVTAPGTTITQYEIRYRYTSFAGQVQDWRVWQVLTGNPPLQSANFDYAAEGTGNGIYDFYVLATNNLNEKQSFEPSSGKGATVVLDLDDLIQSRAYLPLIQRATFD